MKISPASPCFVEPYVGQQDHSQQRGVPVSGRLGSPTAERKIASADCLLRIPPGPRGPLILGCTAALCFGEGNAEKGQQRETGRQRERDRQGQRGRKGGRWEGGRKKDITQTREEQGQLHTENEPKGITRQEDRRLGSQQRGSASVGAHPQRHGLGGVREDLVVDISVGHLPACLLNHYVSNAINVITLIIIWTVITAIMIILTIFLGVVVGIATTLSSTTIIRVVSCYHHEDYTCVGPLP